MHTLNLIFHGISKEGFMKRKVKVLAGWFSSLIVLAETTDSLIPSLTCTHILEREKWFPEGILWPPHMSHVCEHTHAVK